eukprot:CAMPEP_0118808762 /NCGR_PEP_ID=MMETSP1161-20130426/36148_1 /TAXON_ID=249345 /ORGANISM="Picochlorum oklahomensis, Strain CCMP2329" /LENGTH=367 /DNA_ID=CAMNT_0006738155 /DNA_START=93 /DNA_END=1194 /DNA_ORIENTATION=+
MSSRISEARKIVYMNDHHALLSKLLLKAEKSPDSLERMLAVTRLVLTFISQIVKPGKRSQDIPTVVLGEHYLSHREMGEELHRGDHTRSYLQELCAYDPVEAPIRPRTYYDEGHSEVATCTVRVIPRACAKLRREGILLGGTGQSFIEIAMEGQGKIRYPRHDEEYEFELPSVILNDPLAGTCTIDLDGVVEIDCQATGLRTELKFKPWRGEYVKGEVKSLLGSGMQTVAHIEGHWDADVSVHSVTGDATGVVFSTSEDPPQLQIPPMINLADPGPQTIRRLWVSILESILYCEQQNMTGSSAKKLNEVVTSISSLLRKSLMYEVPENPQGRSAVPVSGKGDEPGSHLATTLDNGQYHPSARSNEGW